MEDLNPQVVKGFGRRFKGCNRVRGVYLCNTDKGIKKVKKVDSAKDNILFQHMAKEQLYSKGFKNIDRFCISVDGMPYYIFNDSLYIMSDYIEGVECDFSKNLKSAVQQLAVMHKSADGIKNLKCNDFIDINMFYKKRTIEMLRLKKRISNISSLTELDILILKNYDYYYNQCIKSIDMIEKSKYNELLNLAKQKGSFCHNNYREENVIININGTYVTNFENCTCDIHIMDLANIIRRYMKKPYCGEEQAYEILELYNNIKTIDKDEIIVLLAILTFPYKFLKICNKYYNRRRTWIQSGMTYSLELYLNNKEKNDRFLQLVEKNI